MMNLLADVHYNKLSYIHVRYLGKYSTAYTYYVIGDKTVQ